MIGRMEKLIWLSKNVANFRREKGWSQDKLAEASKICTRYLSRIESGSANPTSKVLIQLSEALGVEIGDLFQKPKEN